jgi:pyridoxine 4-dehydrogenase
MRYVPKYQTNGLDQNLKLVEEVQKISVRMNCTIAQLDLAWVKYLSEKPGMPLIIPVPGATTQEHVSKNLLDMQLADTEALEISNVLDLHAVRGQRYGEAGQHLAEL